ncbi:hypothetical protein OpiT1DRAFT_01984 [Opitutaceae bacterium TAV1]|uniref:hypothetical protein n=1 Tax=Geminisphaera colitermitum TaxID=1148786 RepID=UPI000158C946|nr:hypothetical protein [Geminisphaera colitermitum]EIP97541.1 hypothetical protein OpiT1DRAFT_01984 [Opitutaceae bacterium TAV1]
MPTDKTTPPDTATHLPASASNATRPPASPLTDIHGLRFGGIFPVGREPSIRTLRQWTKLRLIPSHKVGHFVYYDLHDVASHIRSKLKIPART